jgi:hypothetical protein
VTWLDGQFRPGQKIQFDPNSWHPLSGAEANGVTLAHSPGAAVTVNSDTWTLNDVAYGAEPTGGATRHLVVVVTYSDADISDDAHTVAATLGGSAVTGIANERVQGASGTGGAYVGIIEMPTGTSGQLVFTITNFSGTMDFYGLAVYRAIGLSSATPTTTPVGTTDITLVVPANGFGVAGAAGNNANNTGAWSGADATTAYSGQGGAGMLRTVAGSVVHDSANASIFAGATWTFT